MNIYVASSWRNVWQPGVVEILRSLGHDVYDFRAGNAGFSWSEIDEDWRRWSPKSYREALSHPVSERGFGLDMNALRACDGCVLVLPCGASAHLELGWAIGAGKLTAVMFPYGVPVDDGTDLARAVMFPYGVPVDDGTDLARVRGRTIATVRPPQIEPELMAKAADAILLDVLDLEAWAGADRSSA